MNQKLFFLALVILYSCNTNDEQATSYYQEKNASVFEDKFRLEKTDTVAFGLDTEMIFDNPSIHYFEEEGKKYLSILNHRNNHTIYVFDYETRALVQKTPLYIEGPNSVQDVSHQTGLFMKSRNEIYITQPWNSMMIKLNGAGEILEKILLPRTKNVYNAYSTAQYPMKMVGNELMIGWSPALKGKYSETYTTLRVNLSDTSEQKWLFQYPSIYDEAYWGSTPFKYTVSSLLTLDKQHFLASFPLDGFVYVYDKAGNLEDKHFIGSKYMKAIKPYSDDSNERFIEKSDNDYKKEGDYAVTNSEFGYLRAFPRNNLYVRMAYIRPSMEDYKSKKGVLNTSFIIFDNTFNKLGETLLGEEYNSSYHFMNEKGLHIANIKTYEDDENFLIFDVYKIAQND